jgi:hypothetical protein
MPALFTRISILPVSDYIVYHGIHLLLVRDISLYRPREVSALIQLVQGFFGDLSSEA